MKNWCLLTLFWAFACNAPTESPAPCLTSGQEAKPGAKSERAVAGMLTFSWQGQDKAMAIDELIRAGGAVDITIDDPYYEQEKHYRALPLVAVLEQGFGKNSSELALAHFVLQAKDGYATPVDGKRLIAPEVYLAFADLEHEQWQPIGPRGADPGPLYVVWKGPGHSNTDVYPHPWALSRISATQGSEPLTATQPKGGFGTNTAAQAGYAIFERRCLHCHSINQQGGKLGPDLNVPRNVLGYRPEADVRAFIKNPESFRYSSMLPNPDLTENDLDSIVAYLKIMSAHQTPKALAP